MSTVNLLALWPGYFCTEIRLVSEQLSGKFIPEKVADPPKSLFAKKYPLKYPRIIMNIPIPKKDKKGSKSIAPNSSGGKKKLKTNKSIDPQEVQASISLATDEEVVETEVNEDQGASDKESDHGETRMSISCKSKARMKTMIPSLRNHRPAIPPSHRIWSKNAERNRRNRQRKIRQSSKRLSKRTSVLMFT